MSEASIADILATLRFLVGQVVPIATAIGVIATGYYAYKSKDVGEKNSEHLAKQDATIAAIPGKVADIAAETTTAKAIDPIRHEVDGLAAQLRAIRDEPGPGGG